MFSCVFLATQHIHPILHRLRRAHLPRSRRRRGSGFFCTVHAAAAYDNAHGRYHQAPCPAASSLSLTPTLLQRRLRLQPPLFVYSRLCISFAVCEAAFNVGGAHRPRSPSPSPPPPLQTIRLDIELGGPDNHEVNISGLAKSTGSGAAQTRHE